jgi:tetratricopeptide (TPR) repeat protein
LLCARGIEHIEVEGPSEEFWLLRVLLARCLSYQGDFANSVAVLKAPSFGKDVSIETQARVLNQKAFGLSRSGKLIEAKETLDQAKRLAKAVISPALTGEIEINRSTLFFYLSDYDEVEISARAALQIGEEKSLPMIEASASAAVGKSYMYRQRQADAIPWFERALAIYEKEGVSFYADIMRSELGCCHFALREDDKAFGYFTRALRVSRESGALASLHIDLANMGCLHLRRGEFCAAICHFQEALQIAQKLGDNLSVAKWLQNLAIAYSQMGDPALSANFQNQAEQVAKRVNETRAAAR